MNWFKYGFLLLLICGSILCFSCAQKIYQVAYPTLSDNKYDSEFPYKNCWSELEDIVDTVRKINCTAYYEAWTFPPDSQVALSTLTKDTIEEMAYQKYYFNSSVSLCVFPLCLSVSLLYVLSVLVLPDHRY